VNNFSREKLSEKTTRQFTKLLISTTSVHIVDEAVFALSGEDFHPLLGAVFLGVVSTAMRNLESAEVTYQRIQTL
jgi:hypothetical protein